ncbi:MAG: Uma2 family endonuclease [Candidatus Heimdallarchaeota archaeon]
MTEAIAIPESQATLEDYEAVARDFKIVEFISGDIIVTPPPSIKHQSVITYILTELSIYFKKHSGKVFSAPIGVKFKNNDVLEPDIVVIPDDKSYSEKHYIIKPPLLVIEVLSPNTQHRDWGYKKDKYEEFGIQEYWIIDPETLDTSIFVVKDKKYQLRGKYTLSSDKITSEVLKGFEIGPTEI